MYFTTGLQNEGGESKWKRNVEWMGISNDRWDKFILMINGWSVLNKRVLLMIDELTSVFWWWE